jgi:hypothetical protein
MKILNLIFESLVFAAFLFTVYALLIIFGPGVSG